MNFRVATPVLIVAVLVAFYAGRTSVTSSAVTKVPVPANTAPIAAAPKVASDQSPRKRLHEATSDKIAKTAQAAPERIKLAAAPGSAETRNSAPNPEVGSENKTPVERQIAAKNLLSEWVAKEDDSVFVSSIAQGHELVQKESMDPDWGAASDQSLAAYFQDRFGDRLEIPSIDCRTDICEVLAASKVGDSTTDASAEFQAAIFEMRNQPWFSGSQFDANGIITAVGPSPDGRALFIMYVTRK